ncbi:DDB1- and CUL4-associated factor 10 [Diachasma alloeum]|uniref:DDB1- and CUL4-associated factor 10 n=1 Tax=Diachasma alloeum TaxID=454923 RepID=UPI0007384CBD|nr:DDB1- and CUL4-associated factor 10 [Diachasma alloeum]
MPKIRMRQSHGGTWLQHREMGMNPPLGHSDRFFKTLYSSIQPVTSWDHGENPCNAMHGGVFNLEFSPDGSLLVGVCEKKSILMFDPLCRRLVHAIDNAHNDCVNCARFLDQRMFATCSDDSTVALWDARNLKHRIRTLQGHSNWVKNIEYSPNDGLLLTSDFDGSIYTWDINSYSENSSFYNRVFHTNGLMRTRLTPDASKMLICTTSGYLIIIHNLKLSTLTQDLAGFKPNMYRLMQLSQTTIPAAASFTHLFSQSRQHNRVEFLTDFPVGDDAEVISSLQVHPQGWCALSRNVSNGEKSEWTCIHDIQERESPDPSKPQNDEDPSLPSLSDPPDDDFEVSSQPQPSRSGIPSSFVIDITNRARIVPTMSDVRPNSFVSTDAAQPTRPSRSNGWRINVRSNLNSNRSRHRNVMRTSAGVVEISSSVDNPPSERPTDENRQEPGPEADQPPERMDPRIQRGLFQLNYLRHRNMDNTNFPTANVELHVSSSDVWEALVAIREARLRRERERELYTTIDTRNWLRRSGGGVSVPLPPRGSHTVVILGDRGRPQNQTRQGQQPMYAIPRNHKIHQNVSRLTHYIEEPNVGSGYIKELCFSADGRLICSPFGYGVRLLAFSNECQELSNCVPSLNESQQLYDLGTNISHSDYVLSTKFSPRHCLLVSGCLSGKIVWHQPVV